MQFLECVAIVLRREGGFVDHPKDPGGATNWGITIGTLSDWRGRKVTVQEVKDLTIGEARDIYRVNYWDAARCGELPAGLNLCVFDCAVNQGVGKAVKYLQELTGQKQDGIMGPRTLRAVRDIAETYSASQLIDRYLDRRLHAYASLPTWPTFGRGWKARIEEIRAAAQAAA